MNKQESDGLQRLRRTHRRIVEACREAAEPFARVVEEVFRNHLTGLTSSPPSDCPEVTTTKTPNSTGNPSSSPPPPPSTSSA